MTTGSAFGRVRAWAERHGVTVVLVNKIPLRQQAPFDEHVGIGWRTHRLCVARKATEDGDVIGRMIHEMGHLLATTRMPNAAREGDFVAWEWRVACVCQVGHLWRDSMEDHHTEHGQSFGSLSPHGQLAWLRSCITEAVRCGALDATGRRPLIVRPAKSKTLNQGDGR